MTEQQSTQQPAPARVVLAKRAPWNPTAYVLWGTRYAVLDGRRFVAEPGEVRGLWSVWEVDENGKVVDVDRDWVAFAFTLEHIREAVRLRVAGKTGDESTEGLRAVPRKGTGRNHPRNIALRSAWRDR